MPNKPTAVHAKCVHLLPFNHWRPEMKAFSTYDTKAVDPNKWRAGWWKFITIMVQPRGLSSLLEQSPLSASLEMCMKFSSCDAKDISVYYDFFSQCCSCCWYSSWNCFLFMAMCIVVYWSNINSTVSRGPGMKGPWPPRVVTTHTDNDYNQCNSIHSTLGCQLFWTSFLMENQETWW